MPVFGVIVLAEDDHKLRRLYSESLTAAGYRVLSAPDGAVALSLLPTVTPNLVLLDIMMPKLNGIETCKQARKIVGDAVPIVFLSALDQLDILQECLAAGGDDYLIKSDSIGHLLARIAYWMQQSGDQQLIKRRAKVLAEIGEKAANGASARPAATTLSSETNRSVREISEFVRQARAVAAEDFGETVEEKLYLLGYVTGVVEHWSKPGTSQAERFLDYLRAVLRETGILTNHEIRDLVAGFEELAADTSFGIARAHGRNDPVQKQRKHDDYVPTGLAKFASLA